MSNTERHGSRILLRALVGVAILSGIAGSLFWGAIPQAMAHENPNITVKPVPLLWGGEMIVDGANFEEEDEVALTLVGPTGELSLGVVRADREGKFQFRGNLPPEAHPGRYELRVHGRDATAVLDLRVIAGEGTAASTEHTPGLGFHRTGTALQRVAMAVVLGFLAVAGIALLRAGRNT